MEAARTDFFAENMKIAISTTITAAETRTDVYRLPGVAFGLLSGAVVVSSQPLQARQKPRPGRPGTGTVGSAVIGANGRAGTAAGPSNREDIELLFASNAVSCDLPAGTCYRCALGCRFRELTGYRPVYFQQPKAVQQSIRKWIRLPHPRHIFQPQPAHACPAPVLRRVSAAASISPSIRRSSSISRRRNLASLRCSFRAARFFPPHPL